MPAPPTVETSQTIVSQSYIEHQMKQMNDSITTSIGSMFDKFQQSVEQRFLNLSEEINQLKGHMDLYDLSTNTTQGLSTSSNENLTSEIKAALQQEFDGISSEVKAQASRISKLEDCRWFEDEYAFNLEVLRVEFDRVHGSVDNFAKLQADALKELRDDTKQVTSKMKLVWHFIRNLQTSVDNLTTSIKVKIEQPGSSDYP